MSGDVHVERGNSVGARSNSVAHSGKYSSILEYLDEVSDDPPRRGYTNSVPRGPDMFDTGTSSLLMSSMSTSPQQQQRRRRRRRHTDGEESKQDGGEIRAPWDNSMKDTKAARAASSMGDNHRTSRSVNNGRSGPRAGDIEQRDQPSTTRGRTEASHDSSTNRQHLVDGQYSATASVGPSPLSSDDHIQGGGKRGSSERVWENSSNTAGTGAPTTTVGGRAHQQQPNRQRRWVWDEWDDNVCDSSSVPSHTRDQPMCNSGSVSSNRSPVSRRCSPSMRTGDGPVGGSSRSRREKDVPPVNSDDDECPPAARQAFEDVQSTAQSMKANLKQKRSEVRTLH